MKNTEKQYIILTGISILIFLLLNFEIGPTTLFGLAQQIQDITHYYFGIDIHTIDYLIIASFPIFGILLSKRQGNNSFLLLLFNNLKIIISCLITFFIGLLILTIFEKPENPLFPQYLIFEPFHLYSAFWICIGVIFPFLLTPKTEIKNDEIDSIGNNID
ncbi:hypothetical protein [uncultured Flavobacterium sp.]|uniref:hypothetical protein n=1 Tax=uncultured Flavobacterium sp. TaxID=165435 RepID=UPI0025F8FAC0|nr:hypothetical protein [uncultured Flavobacterium sp.]